MFRKGSGKFTEGSPIKVSTDKKEIEIAIQEITTKRVFLLTDLTFPDLVELFLDDN
jgi:hypothetical protein